MHVLSALSAVSEGCTDTYSCKPAIDMLGTEVNNRVFRMNNAQTWIRFAPSKSHECKGEKRWKMKGFARRGSNLAYELNTTRLK